MPETHETPVEITPVEARQGRKGTHLLIILGVSTLLAAIALIVFAIGSSAHS